MGKALAKNIAVCSLASEKNATEAIGHGCSQSCQARVMESSIVADKSISQNHVCLPLFGHHKDQDGHSVDLYRLSVA